MKHDELKHEKQLKSEAFNYIHSFRNDVFLVVRLENDVLLHSNLHPSMSIQNSVFSFFHKSLFFNEKQNVPLFECPNTKSETPSSRSRVSGL